jgi:hypothetical protein
MDHKKARSVGRGLVLIGTYKVNTFSGENPPTSENYVENTTKQRINHRGRAT